MMKWKTWFPLNLAIIRICRMFKDKTVAAEISALMLEIGAKLDNSVSLVQQTCDESELDTYRSAIGEIMGRMLIDIMNPIYKQHPELKPKELN
ncbi:putative cytoplasmic protein [Escherichia coli TA447]|uniref:Putative cytoplasmic protein n=2 Tax=Enterobacterales TaxID=91347 RepID=A0A1X3J4H4_ECOLX|nr:putative cytoplasmic protein [Escherichia coli TA447]